MLLRAWRSSTERTQHNGRGWHSHQAFSLSGRARLQGETVEEKYGRLASGQKGNCGGSLGVADSNGMATARAYLAAFPACLLDALASCTP